MTKENEIVLQGVRSVSDEMILRMAEFRRRVAARDVRPADLRQLQGFIGEGMARLEKVISKIAKPG